MLIGCQKSIQVQLLVRAYEVRGHHIANLDPLGLLDADLDSHIPVELELSHYGFTERDLSKTFTLGPGILPHFATGGKKDMTLKEILDTCKKLYCRPHDAWSRTCTYPIRKAGPSVSSTSTSPTRSNAIGFESALRSLASGTIPSKNERWSSTGLCGLSCSKSSFLTNTPTRSDSVSRDASLSSPA